MSRLSFDVSFGTVRPPSYDKEGNVLVITVEGTYELEPAEPMPNGRAAAHHRVRVATRPAGPSDEGSAPPSR